MSSSLATMALTRAKTGLEKCGAALAAISTKEFSSASASSAMTAEVAVEESVSNAHKLGKSHFDLPEPLMMGPGPSNPYPRANDAMSKALLGHMHSPCFGLMDEIQSGLKYIFQTNNKATFGLSASGGAAMDAAVSNLLEPGEKAVVSVSGIWGERFTEKVLRHGGEVVQLRKEAGFTPSYEEIAKVLEEEKPAVLFLCHGESSSGTKQKMDGIGELCAKHGTLLVVDTVCTLVGEPFFADAWGIDLVYSGAQKCIGCPPGLSPMTFSDKAYEKVMSRKQKPDIFSFDVTEVGRQWGFNGDKRPYHHTPPINIMFAMREALQIVSEEGLENSWNRHLNAHYQLWEGLDKLGLKPFVENPEDRLATVNCISIPEGVDAPRLIAHAYDKYNLEISGGLGGTAGKVFRIGLMGYNCTPRNVESVVSAFEAGLKEQKWL
mmetsp:Transcript_5024/g.8943  ORF Transcript_5024/g.8943 Transcript_5024/m.8943 type:complete len:435 (-) Transcript_5024:112-1416(-)